MIVGGARPGYVRGTASQRPVHWGDKGGPASGITCHRPRFVLSRIGTAIVCAIERELDDEAKHLTVFSSYVGVFADLEERLCLRHYDYERGKPDGYPEAHVQVSATSPAFRAACLPTGRDDTLAKLHFPVGGRRFRPTLEDVIGFLIVEGLADARPGWLEALDEHRKEFHRIQLRAAVRRDPETAKAALSLP